MLKDLNKIRMSIKSNQYSVGMTPIWDEFYEQAQNKKFKNKWDKIRKQKN